ncbi:MAG: queuosine precursor transporter [Clostridia bacterium]|nr:queuosine precursor transporter [Clostridia bacterium]
MNELLLILSLIVEFGLVLLAYRFFGKSGLYAMTVFCTLLANIEVIILINAFGLEQTLGNVLFAASFLITDILSENEGKKSANKAVNLGIFTSVAFIIVTQSWLLYTPSPSDFAMESIKTVFSNTPRIIFASLLVYAITQRLDVWLYHKWWEFTSKRFGDSRRFLWLRNNGSTLISQFFNTFLFNFAAFFGTYDLKTTFNIALSGYVIYVFTSLLDTPIIYLARRLKEKNKISQ